jgi:hypothetical protein
MDCLNPLDCWMIGTVRCKADGVTSPQLLFSYRSAFDYAARLGLGYLETVALLERSRVNLPCGKCAACLIRKRKDMSVRLSHEASMHEDCCFVTLTYNDESVPSVVDVEPCDDKLILERGKSKSDVQTLVPSDVQKFLKRLRRYLEYKPKKAHKVRDHVTTPIRYFCVGEYGSKTHRPHYHLMIFGWKPSDQFVHEVRDGYTINRSAQIEKLWRYGFSTVADVNHGVAKYCARYVTKKFARLSGDNVNRYCVPEFTLQSVRNGGIGAPWVAKYQNNLRTGFVNVRNGDMISKCSIPKYYFDRLRKINLPLWLELRDERMIFLRSHPPKYDYDSVFRAAAKELNTYLYQLRKEQI